jgi:hypothetical protein
MNPTTILAGVVAVLLVAAGAAWTGYDYAAARCKAAEADRRALVAEIRSANLKLADGIASRTESAIAGIRVEHRTINREVRHEREVHYEVLENPDCAIPASTVCLLNRARGHPCPGSGAGEPARPVPGARPVPDGSPAPAR